MESFLETHPYNDREIIPPDTRILIVGTAPPPRFSNPALGGIREWDAPFFYGSEDNHLWWDILDSIARDVDRRALFSDDDTAQEAVAKMRGFLMRHGMWMRDVLQTYQRKKPCDAADHNIEPKEFADFSSVFQKVPHLGMIAFTSRKAAEWTFQAFIEQDLIKQTELLDYPNWEDSKEGAPSEKYKRPCFVSEIRQRVIRFYILPTPTGRSREGLKIPDKCKIYKGVLFERNEATSGWRG
jgi:G:T/U-mismatch repair DNA glycosylase